MKFTCSVQINKPINEVVDLFDDTENLKYWQDGFLSTELISGKQGTVGARSKIRIRAGKSIIVLNETILVKNLPAEMTALYEHQQMDNTICNRFTSTENNGTLWTAEINYTRLKGLFPRVMAALFPGMFKKQTQKWLDNFKLFAEGA